MDMLNKGMTGADIRKRFNVSSGYISTVKKLLANGIEAKVQSGAPEVTEELKEMAYSLTQGTGRTPPNTSVDAVLDERGARYGNFIDQARVAQRLKNVAHNFAMQQGKTFDMDQAEAIDMIFSKLARILNGDPNYADSWIDIAGYATLVADRLEGKAR
jgi:hypothetical protein